MAAERQEYNLDFDKVTDRRNTDCLKYDFAVERGRPKDVLPLWVADMDFKTSSIILDDIKERTEHGIFGYTETKEDYYEAVKLWMKTRHEFDIEPEWLMKTPGVVFALAAAVRAYTNEGDGVLIQQPVYYPFSEVIEDNGRKVVSNDLVYENGKYRIDFEDFERKIKEKMIKLFFLCSPHNPTGRVWTISELKEIADICYRNRVIVISDEIHEDFVYPGYKHIPFLLADERIKDQIIICTSPTKTFNLAGLQISNIFIPGEKLRSKFKKQIDAAGYSQLNTFGIVACKTAYRYGGEWYEAVKKYIKGNLEFLRDYIEKYLPKIKLVEPEGTYLVWLDFKKYGLSDKELKYNVINKAGLWLDDGAIFGKTGSGFQRVNLATSRSVLKEALDRLRLIT